jgi:hypothetical protein
MFDYSSLLPAQMANYSWLIIILAAWSIVWKGLALWKSARRGDKYWFVALLIINLVGFLEILYIFVITPWLDSKKKKEVVG